MKKGCYRDDRYRAVAAFLCNIDKKLSKILCKEIIDCLD